MAAVTAAIAGAVIAAGSLAYSIDSGNKARKQQQDALDQQQDQANQQIAAQNQAKEVQQRDLEASNVRRRIGQSAAAGAASATTGQGGASPTLLGASSGGQTPSANTSAQPIQAGSNTLLGQ